MIQITDEDLTELLEKGNEIIKAHTPFNIKDKQPTMGQRCLVYEFRYKEWVFAYWQREHRTGTYLFEEWRMGKHRNVDAEYWLPEPDKPE